MIKYLVGYDDLIEVVVNTRADAEEYLLSLVEEAAYEGYILEVYNYYKDSKSYFEGWIAANDFRKWHPSSQKPFSTLYGCLLSYYGEDYCIIKTTALE